MSEYTNEADESENDGWNKVEDGLPITRYENLSEWDKSLDYISKSRKLEVFLDGEIIHSFYIADSEGELFMFCKGRSHKITHWRYTTPPRD